MGECAIQFARRVTTDHESGHRDPPHIMLGSLSGDISARMTDCILRGYSAADVTHSVRAGLGRSRLQGEGGSNGGTNEFIDF